MVVKHRPIEVLGHGAGGKVDYVLSVTIICLMTHLVHAMWHHLNKYV